MGARAEDGVSPSVTFLCTAYRTEHVVVETIESVRRQTRADWQLVIVDNGRSDEMARIVEPYTGDPRITLVRQENRRAAGGINAAAEHARGRHVAVLNSDDKVTPQFMERLVPLLDSSPGVDALACDAYFFSAAGVRRPTFRRPVPERYRRADAVTLREMVEGWVPYYTALVRRTVWEDLGGYRRDAERMEDLAFFLDLVTAGHVLRTVDEPLAMYREDESSTSRSALGVEVLEETKERELTAAVERAGGPEDRVALATALVRSRHRRAVVRARRLLLDGDVAGAREAALAARAVQPDLRTRVLAAALTVAPGALLAAYRAKKTVHRASAFGRVRGFGVPGGRRDAHASPRTAPPTEPASLPSGRG